MSRVIIPVDGESEQLDKQLETLDRVFSQDELEVTVLYVHEGIDTAPDEAGKDIVRSINENIDSLQGIPKTVERAQRTLEENGATVNVVTKRGNQKDVVLSVADDVAADVVLVAGSKRSPVGKAVFGSVTQGVILEGDRPVLVAN